MTYLAPTMTIRRRGFEWGRRTYIMGIVNLSPESFSGDAVASVDEAVAQAVRMQAEGADIIDIGGMSTRPDYREISAPEELRRVLPAIRAILPEVDLPLSIDTYRSDVASQALNTGVHMLNDVMGLRRDPAMARLAAAWEVPVVVMHNQRGRDFSDVIADIREGIDESIALAHDAELPRERLIIDPGFGFGWTVEQNLEMLRRLGELKDLGLPILTGTSRKSTIGTVLDLPPEQRIWGTAATVAIAIANGADLVRVHDVAEMAQVARMTDAVYRSGVRASG
jgi:dihydropteroate synthase